MKKPKIAIIGLSGESVFMNVDRFNQPGETVIANNIHREPGGKGFNQAVAVSKFGADAYFLSAIGDDCYGSNCEQYLKRIGVKGYLVKTNKPTSFATIITDKDGENQVTVYQGSQLEVADLKAFIHVIKDSDLLLLQLETSIEVVNAAIDVANQYHIPVILNPAPAHLVTKELLDKVWAITPNEIEAQRIFDNIGYADSYRTIITQGKKGIAINNKGDITKIPAIKVKTIDTTGAGDVFNAAFAVKIASKETIESATIFAVIASGLSVRKNYVLDSIPSINEVLTYKENL